MWINTADKLPTPGQIVLVKYYNGAVDIARRIQSQN